MRRILPLAALALAGCNPSIYFETEVKGSSTIQGAGLVGGVLSAFPQAAGFTNLDVGNSQDFKNQGVKKEDVKSVKVRRLTLRIVSPSDADFAWLKSLRFQVEAPGVAQAELASKNGIDALGLAAPNPTLEFDVKDLELKPYVIAESMTLSTEANGRLPPKDTTLEATVRLGIDAVILK